MALFPWDHNHLSHVLALPQMSPNVILTNWTSLDTNFITKDKVNRDMIEQTQSSK